LGATSSISTRFRPTGPSVDPLEGLTPMIGAETLKLSTSAMFSSALGVLRMYSVTKVSAIRYLDSANEPSAGRSWSDPLPDPLTFDLIEIVVLTSSE
jgi:hypothetical protein